MKIFFNLTTILLGLGAWILPYIALCRKATPHGGWSVGSLGMCVASLCCTLVQTKYLLRSDFSALDDTIDFVVTAAIILAIISILLNVAVWIKQKHGQG